MLVILHPCLPHPHFFFFLLALLRMPVGDVFVCPEAVPPASARGAAGERPGIYAHFWLLSQ